MNSWQLLQVRLLNTIIYIAMALILASCASPVSRGPAFIPKNIPHHMYGNICIRTVKKKLDMPLIHIFLWAETVIIRNQPRCIMS